MKYAKPEQINETLPGIILLSHGAFAFSLLETSKMLFGDSENLAAFSLEEGDDIDQYRKTFVETIQAFSKGSLILVDLFGGTLAIKLCGMYGKVERNQQVFNRTMKKNNPQIFR